jgi:arylsulfatase
MRTLHFLNRIACMASIYMLISTAMIQAEETRPNIIIMMADDMGYSDIGCYGGEIQTPALDQLANNGLRFTQFYNNGRCCPTRASLLTGLYPHQAGVGWMMADNGFDGYRGELNRRCMTIAEVLKENGYATFMSGKWHVTKQVAPDGPKDNWPLQRGFDRFYGTIHGAGSFYDPNSLTRDNEQIVPDEENFYYTDAIANNAIKFIKEHESPEPFFLYVAFTAPHWPLHALPEDIERYRGRYASGWDALRAERQRRMIDLGLIDERWELTPRDSGVPSWPEAKDKNWYESRMEVYAAMVDRMDLGIGRIVNTLKERSELDNTLILFLADNGGCAEEYGNHAEQRPTREEAAKIKLMEPNELQTAMQPRVTRDGRPVRTGYGVTPGAADTYIAYGKPWANASNTPFRLYKHWNHEGGISTPMIAHWPAQISRHGELEKQPGHLIDLMATCVDVGQAKYPAEFRGEKILPLEGRSLVTAFQGKKIEREALYWEHEGNRAIRQGDWKLVAKGADGPWELYNMADDRTEMHNLAEVNADRVEQMAADWDAYAQRANVYPLVPYNNKKAKDKKDKADVSEQQRFQLKAGANLDRSAAPMIAGKSFEATIDWQTDDVNGVLLAQGGSAHGYSLYLVDNKLQFATRHRGQLQVIQADQSLVAGEKVHCKLNYSADGDVRIAVASDTANFEFTGKVKGALAEMPADGLQVGSDTGGQVGEYENPFALSGKIDVDLKINE